MSLFWSLQHRGRAMLDPSPAFRFTASPKCGFRIGDLVALDSKTRRFIGQILVMTHSNEPAHRPLVFGEGSVLTEFEGSAVERLAVRRGHCIGFTTIRPLDAILRNQIVRLLHDAYNHRMVVGSSGEGHSACRAVMSPAAFRRHTAVIGQSGCGKSYAIGLLIEQLHHRASADIVVLDMNGDFVDMGMEAVSLDRVNEFGPAFPVEPSAYSRLVEVHNRHRSRVAVGGFATNEPCPHSVGIEPHDLTNSEFCAALGLHPLETAEEFNEVLGAIRAMRVASPNWTIAQLKSRSDVARHRIENLCLEESSIWADSEGLKTSLSSLCTPVAAPRMIVIDLSMISDSEAGLVTAYILRKLWESHCLHRAPRRSLIVVDEAHRAFPQRATCGTSYSSLDWGNRIAGEGRKYGLHLLVATQMPGKLHEHVLSQCSNLILMRLTADEQLNHIADVFSSTPSHMIRSARYFGPGEALLSGEICRIPTIVRFGGRVSQHAAKEKLTPF